MIRMPVERNPSVEDIEEALVEGDRPIVTGTARAALQQKTFRTVFIGAFLSNIGTWMQNVVLGAYAYEISKSSTFVGLLVFAQLGPILLLSIVGGVIADAVDRRRLLVWLSIEQMLGSFVLAFITAASHPSRGAIFLAVLAIGMGNAVYAPTYSALLPGLVGRANLAGAISLNSAQMNASRVIGPIIGSVAYHAFGPAWVFAGNGLTYLFVVFALFLVVLPPPAPMADPSSRGWRQLTVGVRVARSDRVVGRSLVIVFLFSLLSLVWVGQLPVVAAENLGINPKSGAYGILYATFGTGALIGALAIGSIFSGMSRPRLVRRALVGYACTLAVFASLSHPVPAYIVIAVLGAFYFGMITALSTTMQERLEDNVRGRVMALWLMGFGGTVSLGNLFYGPIIDQVGVRPVLLFGVVIAFALAWYADLRPPPVAVPTGAVPAAAD